MLTANPSFPQTLFHRYPTIFFMCVIIWMSKVMVKSELFIILLTPEVMTGFYTHTKLQITHALTILMSYRVFRRNCHQQTEFKCWHV